MSRSTLRHGGSVNTKTPDAFLRHLKETLYGGFVEDITIRNRPRVQRLRRANPTLDAVAKLCEQSVINKKACKLW